MAALAARLDAQPGPVQVIIQYGLVLLMVELGETGVMCLMETMAGDRFMVIKPELSEAEEGALLEVLREILGEEDNG